MSLVLKITTKPQQTNKQTRAQWEPHHWRIKRTWCLKQFKTLTSAQKPEIQDCSRGGEQWTESGIQMDSYFLNLCPMLMPVKDMFLYDDACDSEKDLVICFAYLFLLKYFKINYECN